MSQLHCRLIAGALLCFVASSTFAATASLRLFPEETLPAIPVAMQLTVVNESPTEFLLQNGAKLRVTRDAEQFQAAWPYHGEAAPLDEAGEDELRIPPGGTAEFYLPLGLPLHGPPFFCDTRLWEPGTYRLELVLNAVGVRPEGDVPLVSSPATLTVRKTTGADEAVRQLILKAAAQATPPCVAIGSPVNEIFELYPDSEYLPFFAYEKVASSPHERIENIDFALSKGPRGPIADLLRGAKAGQYSYLRGQAFGENDLPLAVEYAEKARDLYGEVIRQTPYPWIRIAAERARAEIMPANELTRLFYALHARDRPAPIPIRPIAECADRTGGVLVARFGYENANEYAKMVLAGKDNALTPGGAGKVPQYFQPGKLSNMFSAVAVAEQIVWTVNGNRAVATDSLPKCSTPAKSLPIRPIVECVRHENEGVVVSFGYENPNPFALTIPIGDQNRFDGTADRGQPSVFLSGRHRNVFKVKVKEEPATWTLGTSSATALPRSSRACLE